MEIDLVVNIGWLRSGCLEEVEQEVREVVHAANGNDVKVILENAYLTTEEKVACCLLVHRAGGHYVKTSTGIANLCAVALACHF